MAEIASYTFSVFLLVVIGGLLGFKFSQNINDPLIYILFWFLYGITFITFIALMSNLMIILKMFKRKGIKGYRGEKGEKGNIWFPKTMTSWTSVTIFLTIFPN